MENYNSRYDSGKRTPRSGSRPKTRGAIRWRSLGPNPSHG